MNPSKESICTDCGAEAQPDFYGTPWTCDECDIILCHPCYDSDYGFCRKCQQRFEEE